MQTKIKICGIHKEKNIECCVENSIDMIGFVFYQKSHRNITIEKAKNNKDVGYLFKNEISNMPKPKPKSDFNKPQGTMGQGTDPGAGYGSMMQSNKLEGPTLLERLKSKGFFLLFFIARIIIQT